MRSIYAEQEAVQCLYTKCLKPQIRMLEVTLQASVDISSGGETDHGTKNAGLLQGNILSHWPTQFLIPYQSKKTSNKKITKSTNRYKS